MKRRILSIFVLLAMLVSLMPDTSLLWTKAAADSGYEEDELVLNMYYNGNLIGSDFNSYVAGGNISFKAGTMKRQGTPPVLTFVEDTNVKIYYTTSKNVTGGYTYSKPADFDVKENYYTTAKGVGGTKTDVTGVAANTGWNGVPLGMNADVAMRTVHRHFGGVSPSEITTGQGASQPYTNGSNIAIPTRGTSAYTATMTDANIKNVEGNSDLFTISAVAYRATTDPSSPDVARNTRTFILLNKPCMSPTCPGPGDVSAPTTRNGYTGTLANPIHRACHWCNKVKDNAPKTLIFSLYSDAYYLFDYEAGILVPGIDRAEWILEYQKQNEGTFNGLRPGRMGVIPQGGNETSKTGNNRTRPDFIDFGLMEAYAPTFAANFNRRGRGTQAAREKRLAEDGRGNATWGGAEVPGFLEMFDPETGFRQIAQSVGVRMKGGWSRGTNLYEQRTFEFYGRNGYNDFYGGGRKQSIKFPLFEEDHNIDTADYNEGNLVHQYRRFRLRNGGSDRESTYMRDEMAAQMWTQTGYPTPPQNYRPAVLYLNGAYYGMTFVKSPRTPNHWDRMYGGRESAFSIIGPSERARDDCWSKGCGRVLQGVAGSVGSANVIVDNAGPMDVAPYWGPRNQSKILQTTWPAGAGTPTANQYRGIRPRVCTGSGNYTCAQAGQDVVKCEQLWSEPDDICSRLQRCPFPVTAVDDDGNTLSEIACPLGKGSECSGCMASCDYDDVMNIVVGLGYTRVTDANAQQKISAMAGHTKWDDAVLNPNGLTETQRWEDFQKRVDVDEMLHYYACNMYAANMDWPGNNEEWWRYWPRHESVEGKGELDGVCPNAPAACMCAYNGNFINFPLKPGVNPHLDGRWRPVAEDLEMGWGIWTTGKNPSAGASVAGANTIESLITRGGKSGLGNHYGANLNNSFYMRAMLGGAAVEDQPAITTTGTAQQYCRAKLINAFSDVMDGAFHPTNAFAVFNRLGWIIAEEHQVMLGTNFNPSSYQYVPSAYRRVAEIAREAIQFGNTLKGWQLWDETSGVNVASDDVWNVWPQWMKRPADTADPDGDTVQEMRDTVALYLGKAPIVTSTRNGFELKEGGRQNEAGGMPKHINDSLGGGWTGRNITIEASLSGEGTAWLNTRQFGVKSLPYSGVTCTHIENTGIQCKDPTCWGASGRLVMDPRSSGRSDDPSEIGSANTTGTPTITGKYVAVPGAGIPITAEPAPGYKAKITYPGGTFEGCHLNTRKENTVYATSGGTVTIEFVPCEHYLNDKPGGETGGAEAYITGVKATRTFYENPSDWIEIANPNHAKAISTRGLYMTTGNNEFNFQLPPMIIRPQQKMYFPTEDNLNTTLQLGTQDYLFWVPPEGVKPFLKRAKTNFNMEFGERLSLSDARGLSTKRGGGREAEVSRVEIAAMDKDQVQLRQSSGRFHIYNTTGGKMTPGQSLPFGIAHPQSVPANNPPPPPPPPECIHHPGQVKGLCPLCCVPHCNPLPCATCDSQPVDAIFNLQTSTAITAGMLMTRNANYATYLRTKGSSANAERPTDTVYTVAGAAGAKTVLVTVRGSRTDGLGFIASAINDGKSYKITYKGVIRRDGSPSAGKQGAIFWEDSDNPLALSEPTGSDGVFTVTYTLTPAQISAAAAYTTGNQRYFQLGSNSGSDQILFTDIFLERLP